MNFANKLSNKLNPAKSLFAALLLTLTLTPQAQAAAPQHPIVLVHGIYGFDALLGIDYFYRVPQTLRAMGAKVYVAQVSQANSTEVRGEQLRQYIQGVLAHSGASKVNIIGHSHGGPTARYVASVSPEIVASVTSIGGVNWGSRFADFLRGHIRPDSWTEWMVRIGMEGLARAIATLSGNPATPQDALAMAESLTTRGSVAFNQRYPEGMPASYCGQGRKWVNGVAYFSWSGSGVFTNGFDLSDYPLSLTALVFNEPNDGLVASCSTHLGQVIRNNYRMNHMDEVNQVFGLVSWFETNPLTLFRQHANRLAQHGL
ncbi:triacylglycerol lipase [Shewanella corallii]|uniref:Triacylglycerol lipase n=1 Tax=Shewanella corallii TaxID=560080 RepID=A0ABT0N4F0_9GAMM|nr:triacylglycerol lipase [Shewanella corallii]